MKYFLDTEFIEGFHKPLFGKRRHFIDLISIGIYAEDGREFYAISKEFNYNDADAWVQDNVILPMYLDEVKKDWDRFKYLSGYTGYDEAFTKSNLKLMLRHKGWKNKEIKKGIIDFVRPGIMQRKEGFDYNSEPEFYAYFADYDWVVFCSLFGRMIDLPKGWPMYCRDLKQMLDVYAKSYDDHFMNGNESFEWRLKVIKNKDSYPKQSNEHNALSDAKWNHALYNFLFHVNLT